MSKHKFNSKFWVMGFLIIFLDVSKDFFHSLNPLVNNDPDRFVMGFAFGLCFYYIFVDIFYKWSEYPSGERFIKWCNKIDKKFKDKQKT